MSEELEVDDYDWGFTEEHYRNLIPEIAPLLVPGQILQHNLPVQEYRNIYGLILEQRDGRIKVVQEIGEIMTEDNTEDDILARTMVADLHDFIRYMYEFRMSQIVKNDLTAGLIMDTMLNVSFAGNK